MCRKVPRYAVPPPTMTRFVGGRRAIILRGEWNDKTMLHNWLAHEVFRQGTWLPTPETRYVHFRLNGRYYGLMLQVERIDRGEYGLKRRERRRNEGLVKLLLACPVKGWFSPIDRRGTIDHIKVPKL